MDEIHFIFVLFSVWKFVSAIQQQPEYYQQPNVDWNYENYQQQLRQYPSYWRYAQLPRSFQSPTFPSLNQAYQQPFTSTFAYPQQTGQRSQDIASANLQYQRGASWRDYYSRNNVNQLYSGPFSRSHIQNYYRINGGQQFATSNRDGTAGNSSNSRLQSQTDTSYRNQLSFPSAQDFSSNNITRSFNTTNTYNTRERQSKDASQPGLGSQQGIGNQRLPVLKPSIAGARSPEFAGSYEPAQPQPVGDVDELYSTWYFNGIPPAQTSGTGFSQNQVSGIGSRHDPNSPIATAVGPPSLLEEPPGSPTYSESNNITSNQLLGNKPLPSDLVFGPPTLPNRTTSINTASSGTNIAAPGRSQQQTSGNLHVVGSNNYGSLLTPGFGGNVHGSGNGNSQLGYIGTGASFVGNIYHVNYAYSTDYNGLNVLPPPEPGYGGIPFPPQERGGQFPVRGVQNFGESQQENLELTSGGFQNVPQTYSSQQQPWPQPPGSNLSFQKPWPQPPGDNFPSQQPWPQQPGDNFPSQQQWPQPPVDNLPSQQQWPQQVSNLQSTSQNFESNQYRPPELNANFPPRSQNFGLQQPRSQFSEFASGSSYDRQAAPAFSQPGYNPTRPPPPYPPPPQVSRPDSQNIYSPQISSHQNRSALQNWTSNQQPVFQHDQTSGSKPRSLNSQTAPQKTPRFDQTSRVVSSQNSSASNTSSRQSHQNPAPQNRSSVPEQQTKQEPSPDSGRNASSVAGQSGQKSSSQPAAPALSLSQNRTSLANNSSKSSNKSTHQIEPANFFRGSTSQNSLRTQSNSHRLQQRWKEQPQRQKSFKTDWVDAQGLNGTNVLKENNFAVVEPRFYDFDFPQRETVQQFQVQGGTPGFWSEWSSWGNCKKGQEHRFRTCNYGSQAGFQGCMGNSVESRWRVCSNNHRYSPKWDFGRK